jgi:hypothetical protein
LKSNSTWTASATTPKRQTRDFAPGAVHAKRNARKRELEVELDERVLLVRGELLVGIEERHGVPLPVLELDLGHQPQLRADVDALAKIIIDGRYTAV